MDIHKIKDLPADELRTLLEGENCGMEDTRYMKPLTSEQLAEWHQKFTQLAIEKATIEDEYETVKDGFKARLKPIQHDTSYALTVIKQRGEYIAGKCYKIPDYDNKMIHIIDADGMVINSRMMKPEERQFTISHSSKAV